MKSIYNYCKDIIHRQSGRSEALKFFLTILFVFTCNHLFMQERKPVFSGYVSGVHTSGYDNLFEEWNYLNKINNRISLEYKPSATWLFTFDLQNRIYYGDYLTKLPAMASMLYGQNDFFPLSHTWIDSDITYFNSRIDRAFVEYTKGPLTIRTGRQRINWGQTLVWNVNDFFNNYSIFDIEYIEKPGCDAVRISWYTSAVSLIEIALKYNENNEATAAAMTRFNYKGIDIQLQGGLVDEQDYAFGTALVTQWKGVSSRTGLTYYSPVNKYEANNSVFLLSTGLDYAFRNNIYLQTEVLYNKMGTGDLNDLYSLLILAPSSPKKLSISEWNISLNGLYRVNHRTNLGITSVYFADYKGLYLSPSYQMQVIKDVDIKCYAQYYSMKHFGERNNMVMLNLNARYHF